MELVLRELRQLADYVVDEAVPFDVLCMAVSKKRPRLSFFTDELDAILRLLEDENELMYRDGIVHYL